MIGNRPFLLWSSTFWNWHCGVVWPVSVLVIYQRDSVALVECSLSVIRGVMEGVEILWLGIFFFSSASPDESNYHLFRQSLFRTKWLTVFINNWCRLCLLLGPLGIYMPTVWLYNTGVSKYSENVFFPGWHDCDDVLNLQGAATSVRLRTMCLSRQRYAVTKYNVFI